MAVRPYIPDEFARKPRSGPMEAPKSFFLLYTCPVVLPGVLDTALYGNFRLFFSTIASMVSSQFYYAQSLLETFVNHFGDVYGKEFLVYNGLSP